MRKIHVVTQKEAVEENRLVDCTAVILDVFLATSTICFLLQNNYQPVYAVGDKESALDIKEKIDGPTLLLGEIKGKPIPGFVYPDPTKLNHAKAEVSAIICSTNGTKAIKKCESAKNVFISSLVNGHCVAESIHLKKDSSSIVLICAGNDNRFSIEDFVGAGQVIEHLMQKGDYALSDSATLARETYINYKIEKFERLLNCETANLLSSLDYEESVQFVIDYIEKLDIVPVSAGEKIFLETK